MTDPRTERRERIGLRLVTHTRRMLGAMLCWTVLQIAAAQYHDGRAQAEAEVFDGR